MIRHIILWKLKADLPAGDVPAMKAEAKRRLEALCGNIPGLLSLTVHTNGIPSSNADMMLESTFEDVSSLEGYQTNPLHLAAAGYVRSIVETRLCLDFEA